MELLDEKITRREFLSMPLLFYNLETPEDKIKEKVLKYKKLSLENLSKVSSISSLKDNSFSLSYELFQDDSYSNFGKASINFNKEKRIMDLGIDEFSSLARSYFWIANIFSDKYVEISNLDNIRFFTEFDENLKWIDYRENIAIKGVPKIPEHYYKLKENKVILDEKEIMLDKQPVYTPLSAVFEILNGNLMDNFEMFANERKSNVKIDYEKKDGFVVFSSRFAVLAIGSCTGVYGILYNNIPLSCFIEQMQKETMEKSYIRAELTGIKIDNKQIFNK